MNIKTLNIVLLSLLFSAHALADVSEPEISSNIFRVNITGKITKQDVDTFSAYDSAFLSLKKLYPETTMNFIVGLNSTGGDFQSSLEIGRLMRENNAIAVIAESWNCFSSCVYLLAGATQRLVYGKVGIHRPYKLDDKSTSAIDQKQFQMKVESIVKQYLKDVNISQLLYEDSIRIPPEKNKILTESELSNYGLNENDPYFHDAQIAKFAGKLGITSSQYVERLARKDILCKKFQSDQNKQSDCYIKIVNEGQLNYP